MASLKVLGGTKLSGTIIPSGNKNAVLPMLCATLLTNEPVTLKNVPDLVDVNKIVNLLEKIGSKISWDKELAVITINNRNVSLELFDGKVPLGMRASLLLIAPLLQRFRKITIDTNIGGCTLGLREIDPHIEMLLDLGVEVKRNGQTVTLSVSNGFGGGDLWPNYASVTATENVVMAAVGASGITTLTNAASEPHVQDLCNMLNKMGAQIEGVGSSKLVIKGNGSSRTIFLRGGEFTITPDHHEITTFLALGAMTGGRVEVQNATPKHFPLIVNEFQKLGVVVEYDGGTAIVRKGQSFIPELSFTKNYIPRIEAAPWPYFPVDLLPLMVSLSLKTKGPTRFWNKVYEGGLFWVNELQKMGARIIQSDPHRIVVLGPADLSGAELDCPYIIRATVALLMAALAAEGKSVLNNMDTIYRGHPHFLKNLQKLGGKIEECN